MCEQYRTLSAASSLLPNNDRKLLSQSHILKQQIAARTEELRTKSDENAQKGETLDPEYVKVSRRYIMLIS
jgi:hypothetical protein